jgi:phosphotransferase system enzyme I (PtsI)
MARALGIPLVVGLDNDEMEDDPFQTGEMLIMDGSQGIVIINPSAEELDHYSGLQKQEREDRQRLRGFADVQPITPDGKKLELAANISSLKELEVALSSGAHGVGLFRTEFLYMDRQRFPREDEQFEVYRSVAERLVGKPLIIRTLDVGGDKHLDYFELPEEDNPFLGYRAIRISLDRTDLFKTQLRAIVRASHYGQVKIMYPLISSVEEVRAANRLLKEVMEELREEGLPFDDELQTGIMIELPAAVQIADLLAEEVDFFSIGTNDLVQFALAVDRMNEQISYMYDPFHPAILRMLRTTVEAAKSKGIKVGVCGEMASDLNALPIWLALDVDELSMSGHAILELKERLLRTCQNESRELFVELLRCRTSADIHDKLKAHASVQ